MREHEKQPVSRSTVHFGRWSKVLLLTVLLLMVLPVAWIGIRYQQRLSWIEDVERRSGSFKLEKDREKAGPEWLRNLLGDVRMRPFEKYDEVIMVEPTDEDLSKLVRYVKISEEFSLGLDHPRWTARGKEQLLRMGRLTNLVIRGDSSLLDDPKLLEGLANLEYLKLSETTVTEAQLSNLEQLPCLDTLFLFETQLTDDMLLTIVQHTDLTGLFLARNHITDDVFLQIASKELFNRAQEPFAEGIEYLYLDEGELSGQIIPALENLQNLDYLGLFNSRITEQEINELKISIPHCLIQYGPPTIYPQE